MAQQVGNCPAKAREIPAKGSEETVAAWYQRVIAYLDANKYDRNYCEFRDDGDASRWADSTHRFTELLITFQNFEAGVQYNAQLIPSSRLEFFGTGQRETTAFHPHTGGARVTVTLMVRGKPNFAIDGNATETINILGRGGAVIGSISMTIIDDDDSAYIGQRRHHPYGASWRRQPHCYTHDCARD